MLQKNLFTHLVEFKSRDISGHQTHFEDLVLLGSDGIEELNDKIEKFLSKDKNAVNMTSKIDGSPAITIWSQFPGYPGNSIQLKSFIQGPNNCMSSVEEIDERYGDRPDMAEKLKSALALAPYIPENEAWWGDCLFGANDKKVENIRGNEYITFHPNKIVYAFSEDNPGYEKVKSADFGIAFHTKFTPNGNAKKVTYDLDASQYDFPNWAYIMSPAVDADESSLDYDKLEGMYNDLLSAEQKLLSSGDYETLVNNEVFMQYWNQFENANLADKRAITIDVDSFFENLVDFIEEKQTKEFSKKNLTLKTAKGRSGNLDKWVTAVAEMKELLANNKSLITDMVNTLNAAAEIKMVIWGGYKNAKLPYSTFYKSKTKGIIDANMEGIAMSDMDGNIVKIVDRSEFSAANRDTDILSGWEHPESSNKVLESKTKFIKNRLRKLYYESTGSKTVVVAFGRLNPPTIGHFKMIDTMQALAERYGCEAKIYLSHSVDKKHENKNPLPYDRKLYWCKKAFETRPNVEVVDSEAKTAIYMLHELMEQGYTDVVYVGGEDRIGGEGDMTTTLAKYNGVPTKIPEMYYKFDSIAFESAGSRNTNSTDLVEKASASYVRSLVLANDFETFKLMVPFTEEESLQLFEELKTFME